MAMNRVINSIWAEISAWGSLIKTATNPYTPSPGSADSSANNQGLAAITRGSPFITVNASGVSPDMPVSTSLVDGPGVSTTALQENSGAYQVVRQYGDIYMFNDGNIISWGGNGKNFNFGNGYEEAHAWANQACVYNNETFPIPLGAMTSFSPTSLPNGMFPNSSAALSDWEWLGGNVSKSWGNDYTYSYGRSYEWSEGPNNYVDAWGNTGAVLKDVMQGNHCTFSYGTGYEEALIEWRSGDPWFHADDANSPYASRTTDDWHSANLLAWTNTKALRIWDASNLAVSKSFGPGYEYQYGATLSIQDGASEEHVYGPSWSYVTGDSNDTVNGNSTENVTGDSTSTVNGNSTETITGNSNSMVTGNSVEQRWGGAAEFFMGGKSEMILGACDEITLSVKVEMKTLGAVEIFGGASLAIYLGLLVEAQAGTKIELSQLKVKAHDAKVTATATAAVQANGAATIAASPINLTTP